MAFPKEDTFRADLDLLRKLNRPALNEESDPRYTPPDRTLFYFLLRSAERKTR